ncbi:U exon protein [reindeer adenovirus 1]|uniref:U exon protein n=1 Tax=reindeer adenovirus 1 TaxID=2885353 RepID=A0AAE8Y6J0_9ADEN|nr:U exon protein [reindeer adenovirus 1]
MKVTYNGEVFESDVDFRAFRKYAYANRIGYESFEEGHWITAHGEKSSTQVKQDLRCPALFRAQAFKDFVYQLQPASGARPPRSPLPRMPQLSCAPRFSSRRACPSQQVALRVHLPAARAERARRPLCPLPARPCWKLTRWLGSVPWSLRSGSAFP